MEQAETLGLLSKIDSKMIGFGGGFFVLMLFFLINRKYLSMGSFVFLGLAIYVLSLVVGILVDGLIKDKNAALVAGFWAPVLFSTLATIWLRYNYVEPPKEEKTDFDHLIH